MKEFDKSSYDNFQPDLVFSDVMEFTPDAYDLAKITNLKPFINLDSYKGSVTAPIYDADVSYIGPITDIPSLLDVFRLGYNVRSFFTSPSMLACYSGAIPITECWNIYAQAKVSPIPKNDIGYRELDIIVAGGNPLKDSDNLDLLKETIKGIEGKKFSGSMSKTAILRDNTNYDRMAFIVEQMGFASVSKKIKDLK